MSPHISIHPVLRRHDRDVALLGRLFAQWARGSAQRNATANRRLDAIEAQLARLERAVSMEVLPVRTAADCVQRAGHLRPVLCPAVLQN